MGVLRRFTVAGLAAGILVAAGCAEEKAPLPGSQGAGGGGTAGSASGDVGVSTGTPAPPPPAPANEAETDQELALKLTGIGGKEELDGALARLDDPTVKGLFEQGFRLCFVKNRGLRNYPAANEIMEQVLMAEPQFPPAYRVKAYCALNTGFDMAGSTALYEEAVRLDPEYGAAHYALSFMLTQFDLDRGRVHFEKAMELGIADERNLAEKFYPPQ